MGTQVLTDERVHGTSGTRMDFAQDLRCVVNDIIDSKLEITDRINDANLMHGEKDSCSLEELHIIIERHLYCLPGLIQAYFEETLGIYFSTLLVRSFDHGEEPFKIFENRFGQRPDVLSMDGKKQLAKFLEEPTDKYKLHLAHDRFKLPHELTDRIINSYEYRVQTSESILAQLSAPASGPRGF